MWQKQHTYTISQNWYGYRGIHGDIMAVRLHRTGIVCLNKRADTATMPMIAFGRHGTDTHICMHRRCHENNCMKKRYTSIVFCRAHSREGINYAMGVVRWMWMCGWYVDPNNNSYVQQREQAPECGVLMLMHGRWSAYPFAGIILFLHQLMNFLQNRIAFFCILMRVCAFFQLVSFRSRFGWNIWKRGRALNVLACPTVIYIPNWVK